MYIRLRSFIHIMVCVCTIFIVLHVSCDIIADVSGRMWKVAERNETRAGSIRVIRVNLPRSRR